MKFKRPYRLWQLYNRWNNLRLCLRSLSWRVAEAWKLFKEELKDMNARTRKSEKIFKNARK